MRKLLICVMAALLAGCMSPSGPDIGAVRLKIDGHGRIARVYMEKSTGNAALDRRVMQYARTMFPRLVRDPLPNHIYRHDVAGDVSDGQRFFSPRLIPKRSL
jgi:hypothetical protein